MIKVLVVCDDLWHPAEVIKMGIDLIEGQDFHFDYVMTAKDILTPEYIAQYPVIICCKGNRVTAANPSPWFEDTVSEVNPAEFEDYIKNGGGFISLHSGNTAKEGSDMAALIGNVFRGHPLRCGVDVHVTADHPITAGVDKDFHIRDEHYAIDVLADDAVEFLRTSSETGGDQPAGYTLEKGDGRLCVITPGHVLAVFADKNFQTLLGNAIKWCAKA